MNLPDGKWLILDDDRGDRYVEVLNGKVLPESSRVKVRNLLLDWMTQYVHEMRTYRVVCPHRADRPAIRLTREQAESAIQGPYEVVPWWRDSSFLYDEEGNVYVEVYLDDDGPASLVRVEVSPIPSPSASKTERELVEEVRELSEVE